MTTKDAAKDFINEETSPKSEVQIVNDATGAFELLEDARSRCGAMADLLRAHAGEDVHHEDAASLLSNFEAAEHKIAEAVALLSDYLDGGECYPHENGLLAYDLDAVHAWAEQYVQDNPAPRDDRGMGDTEAWREYKNRAWSCLKPELKSAFSAVKSEVRAVLDERLLMHAKDGGWVGIAASQPIWIDYDAIERIAKAYAGKHPIPLESDFGEYAQEAWDSISSDMEKASAVALTAAREQFTDALEVPASWRVW